VLRDKAGVLDEETRAALKKELGDCLWYVARLSSELGFSMAEVAEGNIEKLRSRKARGTLQGSGDNR
jgi:NTP pyrophosphatase (non-canonical NTP hydrolase)